MNHSCPAHQVLSEDVVCWSLQGTAMIFLGHFHGPPGCSRPFLLIITCSLCLDQYVESVHDSDMMRCRSSPPRSNTTGLQILIQRWPGRGWRRIHRGDHITYHWVIGVGLTSDTEELCSPQGFYCAYWGHLQTTK